MEVKVPHNFTPRPYQLDFLSAMESGYKYAALMWPRRHGKDKTAFCYIIKRMIEEVGNYGYVFPTGTLAREAAWQNIDKSGFRLLDHIPKQIIKRKLDNQMFIELKNGSTLKFFGSDRQISVGTAYKGLIFSEFALQNHEAYLYLRPVVLENDGFIIIISTPRGKNYFYDLWQMAITNKAWYTQKVTWKDAGYFTEKDIQIERDAGMSDEMIKSEYEVDFTGLVGSYYIKYIDQMRLDGRIGNVPWDCNAKVFTAWDLGISDDTVILFYQLIGNEIHIIDSYSNSGQALAHYAEIVHGKPYLYDTHFAPHDIENRELGTGLSRKSIAENLGINFTTLPTLRMLVQDGIEIVRGTFPRIWIDKNKCRDLIKSLENYRREYDERNNIYKEKPVHDQFSHYADSFRYACIAIKNVAQSQMTPERLERLRREALNY
jgi:phage terminase large subunit